MTRKPDDDFDPHSLSFEEASRRVAAEVHPLREFESLPLREALGRVLHDDILSPLDLPAFANSAMDGYALRGEELPGAGEASFAVVGRSLAGHPFAGPVLPGQAVRIMTGAVVPAGADSVVKQEDVTLAGERVIVGAGHKRGANVRLPGEELRRGERVLPRGERLTPADLGLLASLGIAEVTLFRRPRVAIFSTGDELRAPGERLAPGEIYDSNRFTLRAMLARLGVEILDLGAVGDDREALRAAFQEAAARSDLLITSGGVSVGEADFVKETLATMGRVSFWKIAMKPGKPLAFGHLGRTLFFGLPGNPVAVMTTFYQIVQPSLRRLEGERVTEPLRLRARCAAPLKKSPGRLDFQRGILSRDERGDLQVHPAGQQASHLLSGMSRANCFILLPAEQGNVAAGETVEVEPFAGLI